MIPSNDTPQLLLQMIDAHENTVAALAAWSRRAPGGLEYAATFERLRSIVPDMRFAATRAAQRANEDPAGLHDLHGRIQRLHAQVSSASGEEGQALAPAVTSELVYGVIGHEEELVNQLSILRPQSTN